MSKIESFNKRKGIVDAFGLTDSLIKVVDEIDSMIVVSTMKDGEIKVAYTSGSLMKRIGLLEVAKHNLLIELEED